MVLAALTTVGILLGPLVGLPWWSGFRAYFANDQLSYAAIATNVSVGGSSLVEPFTQTGTSYYPSMWYEVVGLTSRATGLPVYVSWTILGLALVSCAVLMVGWLAFRLSGRAWAPLLPAAALLTGTLATPTAHYWYASLNEHAVLWGPFGTLFTLNAEVAGLSLATIAMSLLVLASWEADGSTRRTAARVVIAAALIGLVANVQTYSFFTGASLAATYIAVRALLVHRSRRRVLITLALVAVILAAGPLISRTLGPLPLFALVLAALAPATWPTINHHRALAATAASALVIAAAPQVLHTLSGLASKDPFLTYRQDSTQNLGVLSMATVVSSIPIALLAIACIAAVWRRGPSTLQALVIAPLLAGTVMAINDLWGFHQEPYRFWLQYAIISLLLLSAVLAWGIATPGPQPARAVFWVATAGLVVVWAVGLADVRGFWEFAHQKGVIDMGAEPLTSTRTLLNGKSGLVMSSKCTDSGALKNAIRGPVAAYNKGLAWPEDVKAFEIFTDPNRRASEDPVALRAAKVRYVITDSACADDWDFPPTQTVVPLQRADYVKDGQPQRLTLWWVEQA